MVNVKVRYRFRFYPSKKQEANLAKVFGTVRFVYNRMLKVRSDSYHDGRKIGYHETSTILTSLKREEEFAWINEVSCVPTQQSLRHLQTAFVNFFEKRSQYPSFKSKRNRQSAEYTKSAFKYDPSSKIITIAKIGKLKVKWSREFSSYPSTVTITKTPSGKYFITLCLDEEFEELPKTDKEIGIDLGIRRLATLNNGKKYGNPRYYQKYQRKLTTEQKNLSRKKKGSNRYNRQRIKVAKIHEKIVNCRADNIHKVTTEIVKNYDVIYTETLNIADMARFRNLGKHINDSGMGMFLSFTKYKTERYGKRHIQIDRFFPSSKRCNVCGFINNSLTLATEEWTCCKCTIKHDRDINAACNILAVGQTAAVRGDEVRPFRTKVQKGICL